MAVLPKSGQVCRISIDARRISGESLHHSNYNTVSQPYHMYGATFICRISNQLMSGTNMIAELIIPFRPLLSTKNEFMWTTEHDQTLTKVKECLTTTPVLAFFNVTKATRICTDASRQGLGFLMQQQTPQGQKTAKGQWHLIQAGSHCLTDA